jgi:hypothetical protein
VEHEPIGLLTHHGLSELLEGPGSREVAGGIEVSDPAGSNLHQDEHVENTKGCGYHDEEIASEDCLGVIPHERLQR